MSNSFKDALIKAGVVSKDALDRVKENERREKIQSKGPTQEGIHAHHIRTDCANCNKTSPDVEYYEHTNRSIIAKWLCIPCADKAWIKDETRQSNQSSHAKAGKFRREFGATKKFPPSAPAFNPGSAQRGNQGQQTRSPQGNQNRNNSQRPQGNESQNASSPQQQPPPGNQAQTKPGETKPAPSRPAQVMKPGQKFIPPRKQGFSKKK